ncbi:hypothetical protein Vretifemale_17438, partial [Volvox reticuliferus]
SVAAYFSRAANLWVCASCIGCTEYITLTRNLKLVFISFQAQLPPREYLYPAIQKYLWGAETCSRASLQQVHLVSRELNTPRCFCRSVFAMKSAMRQSREGVLRHRVSLPNCPTTAVPAAPDQRRGRLSEALLQTANKLKMGNELLFTDFQRKLMKRATAVVADTLLGPGATPSLRLLFRRALRAAVAMASTVTFLLKLSAMVSSLDQLDFVHDIRADAELASTVDTILCPAVPPTLLVRATLFTISVLTYWLNLSMTTDSLVHLNSEHLDFIKGAESVLDLAMSGPGLVESGKGLMKIRAALGGATDAEQGVDLDNDADSTEAS